MAYETSIFILIILCHMLMSIQFVNGRKLANMENKEPPMHEGTIKTIQTRYSETIDCVDIYKQPAFNHPLLKNHTIRMEPDVLSMGTDTDDNNKVLFQSWPEDGHCPEGTIPILRTQSYNRPAHRSHSEVLPRKQLNQSLDLAVPHEYALVSLGVGEYYGAGAAINVWNPATENGEASQAQLWVQAGGGYELNILETGWMAESGSEPKLFIHWTIDNYETTGCYNLDCPGFVQTNNQVALGSTLSPTSVYGGNQTEILVTIQKFDKVGDWWLLVNSQKVGYWPRSILTSLVDRATNIKWGGQITNTKSQGHHTTTDMGSGHFPAEGLGKVGYFAKLGYLDASNAARAPQTLNPFASNPHCYDIIALSVKLNDVYFLYGGPGYSNSCQ